MSLGWRGQKEFDDHLAFFDKMFRTLKKEGNLNPDYITFRKESEVLINYSDNCRAGFIMLNSVMNNQEAFKNFLESTKGFGINERIFMTNFTSTLMYLILMNYSNIENLLLTILKGAKYGNGKDECIDGSETLAILLGKIKKIYSKEPFPREILDTKFRNAIAHGWYYITYDTMIYFEDALLQKKKTLSVAELLRKQMRLNILGSAIAYLVLAMDY